jgi:hypothetical protein
LQTLGKKSNTLNEEDCIVSAPEGFEHRSHVGWSADNGFDVNNLPAEWKHLLKSAGLRKKDLQALCNLHSYNSSSKYSSPQCEG